MPSCTDIEMQIKYASKYMINDRGFKINLPSRLTGEYFLEYSHFTGLDYMYMWEN